MGALALLGLGAFAVMEYRGRSASFPLSGRQLPRESTGFLIEAIPDESAEHDPAAQRILRSLNFGLACGLSDPLASLVRARDSDDVAKFTDDKSRSELAEKLKCASQMSEAFKDPHVSGLKLKLDDDKEGFVVILPGADGALPSALRATAGTVAGQRGFCLVKAPKPSAAADAKTGSATTNDTAKDPCEENNALFAVHRDNHWYLGQRASLEVVLHRMQNQADEPSTSATALLDGFAAIPARYSQRRVLAASEGDASARQLTIALLGPCHMVDANCSDFLPNKAVADIASRSFAVAIGKSGDDDTKRFAYRVALVARDQEQAKTLEADLKDAFTRFRDKVGDNETKLRNDAKKEIENDKGSARRSSVLMDVFFKAVRSATVDRDARVVTLTFDEAIGGAQQKELMEINTDRRERPRRKAALAVLQAAAEDKPPSASSLEVLIGKEMTAYALTPRIDLDGEACGALREHLTELGAFDYGADIVEACVKKLSLDRPYYDCLRTAHDLAALLQCKSVPKPATDEDVSRSEEEDPIVRTTRRGG